MISISSNMLHPSSAWQRFSRLLYLTVVVLLYTVVADSDTPTDIQSSNLVTTHKCSVGSFWSDSGTTAGTGDCVKCSVCGDLEYTRSGCNITHDTVCECQPGYYRDSTDTQCKKCRECPVGWGASPACTSTSNTVCVACPPDSYSSVQSSFKSCQSCTICDRRDEFELQQCNAQQDTTCFRIQKKSSSAADATLTEPACTGEDCAVVRDDTYLYTVPLYCTALGAIILGLLIYVVLRCRWNKKRAAQMMSGYHIKQAHQYQIVQQYPYSTHQQSSQHVNQSLIYLQSNGASVTSTTRYKDLPSNIRRTIVRSLSYDGSWLKLAHNLGFTPSEVSQIQQKAQQEYKSCSAASILITEWTKREFSSVGVMLHALASVNRLDLVHLIHNMNNSVKGSEIV